MTPERWAQVGRLFGAALGLQPDERSSFLDEACGDDTALRREVDSLLEAESKNGSFLAAGAVNDAAMILPEGIQKSVSLVGNRVGHYQVLSLLGAGGMGKVYLAEDSRLKRKIALKLLPTELTAHRDRVRRFEQEARAASSLNHPSILTIYEIGQVDDKHFIAAEFIDGQTLRQRIEKTRMSLDDALGVVMQVASALSAAHAAGIVHRDIKPENIMLRADGLVKVLDFGLAKLTTETGPQAEVHSEAATEVQLKTTPGIVMGTVNYMSPEQARGKDIDGRSDIFSLGAVTYEVLAGHAPFAGDTTADVLTALLHKDPKPLTESAAGVPVELQRIVSKALCKDRNERYQTVQSLLIDLKALSEDLDFAAKLAQASARGQPAVEMRETVGKDGSKHATVEETNTASVNPSLSAGIKGVADRPTSNAEYIVSAFREHKRSFEIALAALLLVGIGVGYLFVAHSFSNTAQIESIAVLPFANSSGNADLEYLSDGMTESLINSLSQLPHLAVKSRSLVFRYKGKEVEPQQVAADLSVQAIVTGRVVQRGDDLTLSLELVDARTGNQLWGEQYNRKPTDLVSLQSEIARDVSRKLRLRLSGADERRLAKSYTANTEAYELYLKGRYHLHKLTPSEIQTSISYFEQAIELDPSYALAYVGLADAIRSSALVSEVPSGDSFPKAKAAAQKAIDIDDTLAEAHAELGFTIFWYDWDWNAAENQLKRALELDPNSADTHLFYAHLLSNMGRHSEGLAEAERARALDPLDLRITGLEALFLLHAGKPDEALTLLQNSAGLLGNSWYLHIFAASAYIEKGMFAEALVEARKAKEIRTTDSLAFATLAYALAKLGKQAEARAVLEELLSISRQRYVSAGNIALIFNGLGQRDETFAWLERGLEQRDPKMVFLKVEPKWKNLRGDPRFQDLLRRVGF